MNRRRALVGGAAALAAVAGVGVAVWRERSENAPGAALWPLRFERPDGGELRIAAFRGKPLVVNFWATWCPPCVGELPLLDGFARARAGWHVVGLAVDRLEPVREFLAKHPVGFPIGLAGLDGVALSRGLGNAGGGLPFSLAFGSDGTLAARKLGAIAESDLAQWAASVR